MYLYKFHQNPLSGSEDNAWKRCFADSDAEWDPHQKQYIGGHNQDQVKHSGNPTLCPNCCNGNKHMRGSRNFRQGGLGQSDKKSSDVLFFFLFFSPQLILQKSNGQWVGPTFSRGFQLLIPYRNPYNL